MDYGTRIKEMAKEIHRDLKDKKQLAIPALQMKIKCLFGIGDKALDKHIKQLQALNIVEVENGTIKVINEEALSGLLL